MRTNSIVRSLEHDSNRYTKLSPPYIIYIWYSIIYYIYDILYILYYIYISLCICQITLTEYITIVNYSCIMGLANQQTSPGRLNLHQIIPIPFSICETIIPHDAHVCNEFHQSPWWESRKFQFYIEKMLWDNNDSMPRFLSLSFSLFHES